MSNAILLAGCGDLGAGLGERLAQEGHDVWGLRRRTSLLPKFLRGWAADLRAPDTLTAPPASFSTIVYTATPPRRAGEDDYRAAYVDGVRNLLHALPTVQRIVLVSSTSVYAQNDGSEVNEDSPTQPTHYSGQILLQGEQLVLTHSADGCIVRFGGIYGPQRTQLLESVRQGRAVCYDGPTRYTNRIHRDDCVRMLHHLLSVPSKSSIYLGVDSCPAPRREVLQWLAKQLHVEPPPTQPASDAPQGRRGRSNKRCLNALVRQTGFTFQYPTYQDGYGAILKR